MGQQRTIILNKEINGYFEIVRVQITSSSASNSSQLNNRAKAISKRINEQVNITKAKREQIRMVDWSLWQ